MFQTSHYLFVVAVCSVLYAEIELKQNNKAKIDV